MINLRQLFLALIVFGFLLMSQAVNSGPVDTYEFNNPVDEKRFQMLTKELRCPKCQNQNLADSNALQAGDLRREIHVMINEGKADIEIVNFMVYRYGDFVLYKPKVNSLTYLLWFGPFVLIIIGLFVVVGFLRRKTKAMDKAPLSDEQQAQLNKLLSKEK